MKEPQYKRYMVFIWDQYYPSGGLNQVHASFDDLNEAIEYAAKTEYDYSTIFDRIEGIEIG